MVTGIPAIRERLHQLAIEHGLPELAELAEATRRRKPQRPRSPNKFGHLTPTETVLARQWYLDGESMGDLAQFFNTNLGRISEAVNG